MKIRIEELRKLIAEALSEAEEGEGGQPPFHELPDASLDVKIDNFLVDAEAKDEDQLGESLLREAEPGEEPDGAEDPQPPASDNPVPDDSNIPDDPPEIDAAQFSREVARLVDNFERLFDIKGVVLRRALNYVGQKYGKQQAKTVQDVLETQFGIYLEEKEEPEAPGADRAGPAMAG